MYTVLSITLPFFAVIFLGTFFSYKKFFDNNFSKNLTNFALYVTLPPFMFTNILKSSNEVKFDWNFIIPFEIVTISILFLSFFISLFFFKNNKKVSSMLALNSIYPNYGYMGIPLCVLAFSEKASIPISLILIIDSVVLLSFTSLFIDYGSKKTNFEEIKYLIIRIFKNPILLGSIFGFLFVLVKIQPNEIILNFLEILSKAATPTALFAIGINLFHKIENIAYANIIYISFIKLIIHPILVFIVFYLYSSNVSILWIKVAILCASLPIAGNVFAMSIYYNCFTKNTSSSILITTVLSTFTVPTTLYLLLNYL